MKICKKCKFKKELTEFSKRLESKDGLRPWCKTCENLYTKNYYKKYPEKVYNEKKLKNFKTWYKNNPERVRNNRLIREYGITQNDYVRMLSEQNNVCLICGKPETLFDRNLNTTKPLSIDHCHTTKKVRGLLCDRHNRMIGLADDDITILKNAIDYLLKSK